MIIEPKENFIVQLSFIQFRITSSNSSGLINVIKQQIELKINQCKLSGSNQVSSKNNGYLACNILVIIQQQISELYICIDQTQRLGQDSVQINTIGESMQCDMCENQSVIYGLCREELKYSENVNGMYLCVYPFEYIDNQCICAHGYLLNKTLCVNILDSLNLMSGIIDSDSNDQLKLLQQNIKKIEDQIILIDKSVVNNITDIENRIISNYSKSDTNLFKNISILDNRIYENITSIINDISIAQFTADKNLLINTTELDWRIFNNVSQLNASLLDQTLRMNDINDSLFNKIELQQKVINDLVQHINCTSNYGHSMVNGSCIQVTCAIQGQQSINGICQCVNINAIIQADSCVCPANSKIIGIACVCSINGQTMQKGQCVCSTTGAVVIKDACTCGVNGVNTSNTCSCPNGSSLVNGTCTCTNINAYISGGQCTCPKDSSLVKGVCKCDKIVGQQIISGSCQCPSGFSVVKDSCVFTNYMVKNQYFECSQEIFATSFDIQIISYQITTSGNFFGSQIFIKDAFIDISDNVFTQITYKPLFQSQTSFINLKIQFGVQSLLSGSFILPYTSSNYRTIGIQQMNIISRPGSQLTVFAAQQLNILTDLTQNANIANLLVNLSFAPSSGNITLIRTIHRVFNISGYQVLGDYVSTQTVSMIGLNLNLATVNLNQVSFKPTAYNVGNGSAYLFGNVMMTSTINVNNFAVILGNSSNFLLLGSISTTSTDYYQFGGIIAQINDSVANIANVIYDSYQQFSTNYVTNSGFLVGHIQLSICSINIQNACMQQNITSTTQQFYSFGLVGCNYGNISIQNASVIFYAQKTNGEKIGIIGIAGDRAQTYNYGEVINLRATITIFAQNSGSMEIGSMIGQIQSTNFSLKDITVIGGNIITDEGYVGGLVGQLSSNTTIYNSTISQMNITGMVAVGGFVGQTTTNQLYIINSKIKFVRLSAAKIVGIVVGYNYGYPSGDLYLMISGSSSESININNDQRKDCASLIVAVLESNLIDGCE
ncbi:Conserved_hypothetical protein [Hexamita inflata]|uniref:Uncharacterized protein n=1 Tax=Hexamita inflata TaxID=28002 RepID=A0ABP1HEE4_9EUKA